MKVILKAIILISIFTVGFVSAETAFSLNSPSSICSGVNNNSVKIYVYDFYKNKNVEVGKVDGSCSNTNYYNSNLSNIQSGDTYTSWAWHGRASSSSKFYVENVEKKKANYQYFVISNRAQKYNSTTGNLERLYTLKPGEKIFMTADLGNKAFAQNKYNDARIVVEHGETSSDINIIARGSMGFYVIGSDNKTYGPFRIDDYKMEEIVTVEGSNGALTTVRKYKVISENILNGIPSTVSIKTIKIVPYDFYNIRGGNFNIFKISVEGYSNSYSKTKNTVQVSNAESLVRHNVTNNMIDISTLRWEIDPNATTTLNFYHHYKTGDPLIYKNNRTIYYGIPYVNTHDSTIESYLSNSKTGKDKNNKNIIQVKLPTKYTTTTTSTKGNTITAGNPFPGNKLYVVEKNSKNDTVGDRKTNLETYDYVTNAKYFFGLDCSSSTYLAEGMVVPAVNSMAASNRYSTSSEVIILGSTTLDTKEFEKYVRDNNKIGKTEQLTESVYDSYYFEFYKAKNTMDSIYESYSLAIPGDIIAKRGHVRMESGYPHVECKDGTHKTDKYTKNFCKNYGGINPDKSYVITTEIGGTNPTNQANGTYLKASDTGWSFTINTAHTDITNIDQIRNQTVNYKINKKYTYKELTNTGYMAFRYKSMVDIMSTSKVEIPQVRIIEPSTEQSLYDTQELRGTIITNYIIQEIKYEINGNTYTVNPLQTYYFSLYYDTPAEVKAAIKAINPSDLNIKISVKQGPNIVAVRQAAEQDSNNFGQVLSLNLPAWSPPGEDPPVEPEEPEDPTPPEDEKPPGESPIDEGDEDDPDGETEGEGHHPDPVPESDDNPGTGGVISIVFIGALLLLLIILTINQSKYNKIKRI